MDNAPYVRPQTPQALLHHLPSKPSPSDSPITKPNKFIILLLAPTSVAGKVQIATSVAKALSCPLFQGDSLHESNAKVAAVGAARSEDGGMGIYQRMWLRKMTRTGLLFPEESRPANTSEGFVGFGGGEESRSTSRRGSVESVASSASSVGATPSDNVGYINQSVFAISEQEQRRKSNPALMVLTHPELEPWHKDAIRQATGEYRIGIIFVPLYKADTEQDDENEEEEEFPVLKPLDPATIRGFTSFDALRAAAGGGDGDRLGKKLKYGKGKEGNLEEEMVLKVDINGGVEEIIEEIVDGVRDVMGA
ncbi:uncharacterized protein BDR25DRAFT_304341 [Lindgomyces ingoldianus]|uniref:Uncharacterized protein n=1 Tax=Lindgomyces ingoldianus TaxID=673940 RepID=A0ACB6QRH3_9PLEO|nr:uncharacterized protein BDR25DRAFT_304341 [Lindgomyces ingoldianus]KAF2469608.1 hypothetical protein BDR25DRAFT_304341 [Lindgomyces ingoldianus]